MLPEKQKRPRVICHMMASVDGRIITDDWPLSGEAREQYEQVHATFEGSALPPVQAVYQDPDFELRIHARREAWPDPSR